MAHVTKTLGVLIGVIALCGLANAQDMRNMSILTGPKGGTYHRFGQDIARVIRKECGALLEVRTSQGSLDNLERLRNEPYTQMAIVQQDVLEYLRLSKDRDPTLKEWTEKFKYVFPLYREEVHIVARRDSGLHTFTDLRGRPIAIGAERSGTYLTATLLLWKAGLLSAIKEAKIGPREGVLRLLHLEPGAPRVDAVFYVAGKPVPLLSGTDARLAEEQLAQLSVVAIPRNSSLGVQYGPAQLTGRDYPWLDLAVETVAVRAVLIAYNFRGRQCDNVAMVARLIKENLDELRRSGHEKWRDVDPDATVPGWERYACVERRMWSRLDACRFVTDDCHRSCEGSERNALACMLCQDKGNLRKRRR